MLTNLAAILDLGAQSRLARTPPPGQVKPTFKLPRRPIYPKSTWGVEQTVYTRWISISVARSRPGGPRWPQVAFLERPPGGVDLARKVIEHGLKKTTTGVNATSRGDGVPNVADEEPGACFGGKKIIRLTFRKFRGIHKIQNQSGKRLSRCEHVAIH